MGNWASRARPRWFLPGARSPERPAGTAPVIDRLCCACPVRFCQPGPGIPGRRHRPDTDATPRSAHGPPRWPASRWSRDWPPLPPGGSFARRANVAQQGETGVRSPPRGTSWQPGRQNLAGIRGTGPVLTAGAARLRTNMAADSIGAFVMVCPQWACPRPARFPSGETASTLAEAGEPSGRLGYLLWTMETWNSVPSSHSTTKPLSVVIMPTSS